MKDMLGAVVKKLVEIPSEMLGVIYDFLEKLSGGEKHEWFAEFKKFLRKEKCWTGVIVEKTLEYLGIATIPARTERFIPEDHFVVNIGKKARVKISFLGDNFRNNFLNKTEEVTIETVLDYHRLKKSSRDISIITELGGEEWAETSLSNMFSLMEKQPNGEDGDLLTNGYANIFYVRDKNGLLWAVFCYWHVDGWRVNASSVDSPRAWSAVYRVFSRNS